MTTFSTDIDLLHWEPNLLKDAQFASQQLMKGNADVSGTTLTISSGSFADSHIEKDMVVVLSGSISGCFPIVSVDSATELTISPLFDRLFPDEGDPEASPVGSGSGLEFVIRTFFAQRRVVSELLRQAAGIVENESHRIAPVVLNPAALRRPCTLGTLQLIYNALAATAEDPAELKIRAGLYERLFRRAMRGCRVDIDLNGDGRVDVRRELGVVRLKRR